MTKVDSALLAFAANIVSLLQVGCFVGSLASGSVSDWIGRRWALIVSGLIFCAGSLMQTLSFGVTPVVFVGRVVGGLGVGAASCLVRLD
jgi:MFS family permease